MFIVCFTDFNHSLCFFQLCDHSLTPLTFTHVPSVFFSNQQLLLLTHFFDLLVCFQQFSSSKITYFVKLFDAHLHLSLVPLYVIYGKYHTAQHVQVKAVICLSPFSSLLSGLFRHASQSSFYTLRQK